MLFSTFRQEDIQQDCNITIFDLSKSPPGVETCSNIVFTVVFILESTKLHLCSKLGLFKMYGHILRVLQKLNSLCFASTPNNCRDILKSAILLHKQGFVDSQMRTTVFFSI